ncbi:hypothetical protein OROGR_029590 [Orobanche gracilis]
MEFSAVFLCSVMFSLTVISNNGVGASHQVHMHSQSFPAGDVKQLHRTGYHFQPTKNWING